MEHLDFLRTIVLARGTPILSFNDIRTHHMLNIDLWSLEPLMRIDKPPDQGKGHGSAPHKDRPVHGGRCQIASCGGR